MNKINELLQNARRQLFANVAKTAEQNPDLLKARGLTDEQIAKIKEVANDRAKRCGV
jgi:hypothetical protein